MHKTKEQFGQEGPISSLHLATYIIPALILSVILNIPKFLEAELVGENLKHEKFLKILEIY